MTWTELTTLLMSGVALVTVLVQWYNGRTARQSGDASAAKDISEAYKNLKESLESRIDDLEKKVIASEARAEVAEERAAQAEARADKMEEELAEYSAGVRILISQLASVTGEKPLWKPKDSIG